MAMHGAPQALDAADSLEDDSVEASEPQKLLKPRFIASPIPLSHLFSAILPGFVLG